MNISKKKCFIAMAFGREDTDSLYQNFIHSAIEEAGFIPIRVDILNHNDRIDQRIRKEIEGSVVLVADLTYARPSVYWEAGYGERSIPVIYTARRDHFSKKESDIDGNLAVHFDLRNANIIQWEGEGNLEFKNALQERILLVTRELRKDEERQKKIESERNKFLKLSIAERRTQITKALYEIVKANKFTLIHDEELKRSVMERKGVINDKNPSFWKLKSGTAIILSPCPCYSKFLKNDLNWIRDAPIINSTRTRDFVLWGALPDGIKVLTRRRVRRIRRIRIAPSLAKMPIASTEDVFEYWRRLLSEKLFYRYSLRNSGFTPDSRLPLMPSSSEILFLHSVQSEYEFITSLENLIVDIDNNESSICNP